MQRVGRFILCRSKSRFGGGRPLRNQLSHLCVARSRRGQQVAHRPRSMQVNATRPDAQRLQSATCRKQPGARHCRRAAGGRCLTICSFFPSYFRPSFSPPSLSRDHRPVRTVRKSLGTSRASASDGFATDTYAQFSGASRTDARPRVSVPRRGHVIILPHVPRENSRGRRSIRTERRKGVREIAISDLLGTTETHKSLRWIF